MNTNTYLQLPGQNFYVWKCGKPNNEINLQIPSYSKSGYDSKKKNNAKLEIESTTLFAPFSLQLTKAPEGPHSRPPAAGQQIQLMIRGQILQSRPRIDAEKRWRSQGKPMAENNDHSEMNII